LAIVGTFGVDDFGGRVVRADQTGELALFRLVGSLRAGLADFVDDVEEGADRAVDAAGEIVITSRRIIIIIIVVGLDGHAARRAAELWTLDVALELDVEDVQQLTGRVIDIELSRQSRFGQQRPQLIQFVQHHLRRQSTERRRRRPRCRRRQNLIRPV
jgi:hypothetical protein